MAPQKARRRVVEADDLYRLRFVSDPQVSPDGAQVVYVVSWVDPADHTRYRSQLMLADFALRQAQGERDSPENVERMCDGLIHWPSTRGLVSYGRRSFSDAARWTRARLLQQRPVCGACL